MKQAEMSAKLPKKEGVKGREQDQSATIAVNYAETLDEAKQMFGEEAVLSNAFANWRVTLQAGIRRGLESGKTPDQIAEEFAGAKMGVATGGARVDPIQASLAKFKTMNPEEQKAYLQQLRKLAAG